MRRHLLPSKWILVIAIVMGLVAAPTASYSAVNKPAAKTSKKASSAAKKPAKKTTKTTRSKRSKKTPFILAPKTTELAAPEEPHAHNFSPEFIQILADGNLNQAARSLMLEEASDKVGYMINEVISAQGKAMPKDRNAATLQQGMANHNIFLFLQRQGRTVPRYAKTAAKYYSKLVRKPDYKNQANILLAALESAQGNDDKAQRYFDKVDVLTLIQDGNSYSGLEYVALYYASRKDVRMALRYLYMAYQANPGLLLQWIHVGDDFWMIEEDPDFAKTVAEWKTEHQKKLAQIQRDKSKHSARKKKPSKKKR